MAYRYSQSSSIDDPMVPRAARRSPRNTDQIVKSPRQQIATYGNKQYLEPKPIRSKFSPSRETENDDEGDVGDIKLVPKIIVQQPRDGHGRRKVAVESPPVRNSSAERSPFRSPYEVNKSEDALLSSVLNGQANSAAQVNKSTPYVRLSHKYQIHGSPLQKSAPHHPMKSPRTADTAGEKDQSPKTKLEVQLDKYKKLYEDERDERLKIQGEVEKLRKTLQDKQKELASQQEIYVKQISSLRKEISQSGKVQEVDVEILEIKKRLDANDSFTEKLKKQIKFR